MDFMDFSRRLYRWASEGVDMYVSGHNQRLYRYISIVFVTMSLHLVYPTWCERHHRNAQIQHLSCCCLVVVLLWCENTIS